MKPSPSSPSSPSSPVIPPAASLISPAPAPAPIPAPASLTPFTPSAPEADPAPAPSAPATPVPHSIPTPQPASAPTPRQQHVLDFVRRHLEEGLPAPTLREIARHLGLKSFSPVKVHLDALRRKGLLEGPEGAARSLRLAGDPGKRLPGIPLLGSIPAGLADLRAEEQDGVVHVDMDSLKIPKSSRVFALKVTGDSMIGKCIMDGDVVILEQNAEPKSGDVVAALIDGQSTLKTFLLDRGRPFLRAENPRYPNLIPLNELMIQGVMRMLVRTTGKKK